jgi:hypothetical protein
MIMILSNRWIAISGRPEHAAMSYRARNADPRTAGGAGLA